MNLLTDFAGVPAAGPPPHRRRHLAAKLLGLAAIVAVIGAGASILLPQPPAPKVTIDNRRVAPPGDPVRVSIPTIGIDSQSVVPVGLDRHGAIATPCDPETPAVRCNVNATGWYTSSPRPGAPGDAIIDGHVDWYGPPPTYRPDVYAIFTHLDRARVGDQVTVVDNLGHSRVFVVDSVATLPYPQVPSGMFAKTGRPSLTLITCKGVRFGRDRLDRAPVRARLPRKRRLRLMPDRHVK